MQGLAVQDLLAEMLRTAEAAADRERHGGASAGEVCMRRGSMAADVCTQSSDWLSWGGVLFLTESCTSGLVQPVVSRYLTSRSKKHRLCCCSHLAVTFMPTGHPAEAAQGL